MRRPFCLQGLRLSRPPVAFSPLRTPFEASVTRTRPPNRLPSWALRLLRGTFPGARERSVAASMAPRPENVPASFLRNLLRSRPRRRPTQTPSAPGMGRGARGSRVSTSKLPRTLLARPGGANASSGERKSRSRLNGRSVCRLRLRGLGLPRSSPFLTMPPRCR